MGFRVGFRFVTLPKGLCSREAALGSFETYRALAIRISFHLFPRMTERHGAATGLCQSLARRPWCSCEGNLAKCPVFLLFDAKANFRYTEITEISMLNTGILKFSVVFGAVVPRCSVSFNGRIFLEALSDIFV